MPAFSTSLGCLTAPFIYNQSTTTLNASIGTHTFDHAFDIRGGAVGTFIITEGTPESEEIKYEMTLRTDDEALLKQVYIRYPEIGEDGTSINSQLLVSTPYIDPSSSSCMRYDIKMYVPPNLKKLHVASHTAMHVQFDPNSNVVVDDLYVTMFAMSTNNLVLPSLSVRGKKMALEVYRGWIVGDVAVDDSTSIVTQRGDGVANVRVLPTESSELATFRTTTGAGRTDVTYIRPKDSQRLMSNTHISARNADMYLTYREAGFSGLIDLDSQKYSATGTHPFPNSGKIGDNTPKWTHWTGDKDGKDQILIKSRGWTGLYF